MEEINSHYDNNHDSVCLFARTHIIIVIMVRISRCLYNISRAPIARGAYQKSMTQSRAI